MQILPKTRILAGLTSVALLSSSHAELIDTYFGTSGDGGIQHAVFDNESGELSAIRKAVEVKGAGFIAIHPDKPYIYSTAAAETRQAKDQVAAFKINADKSLTQLNAQSSEGFNACHVSVDATGNTLMVANYSSNHSVASFKINTDGSLTAAQSMHTHVGSGRHPNRQKGPHPHSIFPNPANTFAYAPDLGTDQVEIYTLDSAHAKLTSVSSAEVPGGAKGPRHMKFSANGRYAYVLLELTMEIAIYQADADSGMLKYIETVSTFDDRSDIDRMTCSEIRIHPNGQFVYSANRDLESRDRDTISIFARDAQTGRLTLLANEPARVTVPRNFNITPCGKWLIAGGQKSNDLSIFSLDLDTGLLAPHGDTIPFEGSPICVEFLVH